MMQTEKTVYGLRGKANAIAQAIDESSGEIIINSKVPDKVAYAIVKAMAEGAAEYRNHHAAFRGFTAEGMPTGLFLPLHPGAAKYYKEMGYLK